MTQQLKDIYDAFTNAHIPYAYNVFPTDYGSPSLPYVTGYVDSGRGMLADDENYYDTMDIRLILFTKTKDPSTEDAVRGVLKTLGCPYTWEESYSTDEKMYVITYSITMDA